VWFYVLKYARNNKSLFDIWEFRYVSTLAFMEIICKMHCCKMVSEYALSEAGSLEDFLKLF